MPQEYLLGVLAVRTVCLLTVLLFAGCAASTPDPLQSNPTPIIITSPTDFSAYDGPVPAGGYVHDYWGGRDRITILDKTATWRATNPRDRATYSQPFYPAEGQLVLPGTKNVHIHIDTSKVQTSPGVITLQVLTPDQEFRMPLKSPIVLPSTHEMNDREHQVFSAWMLRLVFEPTNAPVYVAGEVSIRVEIERGLELRRHLADPFATSFKGSATVVILQATAGPIVAGVCGGNCLPTFRPNATIPHGVQTVQADVKFDAGDPGLQYHGADSRAWKTAKETKSSTGAKTFEIPIQGRTMTDSPYVNQTAWEFRLTSEPVPGQSIAPQITADVKVHIKSG